MDETGTRGGSVMRTQGSTTLSMKSTATGLYCEHAKGLLEALTESIRDLVLLHAEQFDSVMTGDLDGARFGERAQARCEVRLS
jgi:hypothetical protein